MHTYNIYLCTCTNTCVRTLTHTHIHIHAGDINGIETNSMNPVCAVTVGDRHTLRTGIIKNDINPNFGKSQMFVYTLYMCAAHTRGFECMCDAKGIHAVY